MKPRLTLVERLRIAREAHAAALQIGVVAIVSKVFPERPPEPPPEDRSAAIAAALAVEKSPLHVCGVRMVICATCREWICRATGHLLHVCRGAEFSQVAESAPGAGGKGGGQ